MTPLEKSCRTNQTFLRIWTVFGVAVSARLLWHSIYHPWISGDTLHVIRGAEAIRGCVEHQLLGKCPWPIFEFPLFQYLPALVFVLLGLSTPTIAKIFPLINFGAFILMQWIWFRHFRKQDRKFEACLAILLFWSSPLIWYSTASFNEPVAALLTLGLVVGLLRNAQKSLIFTLSFFAGITKEVAPPFLVALAVLALLPTFQKDRAQTHHGILTTTAGALLAGVANSAFNWIRFGDLQNAALLDPLLRVQDLGQTLFSFLAILFSPNGGIFLFWPLAVLPMLVAFFYSPSKIKHYWLGIGIPLTLAALAFGFANWYAPFGWAAWGPRLLLPWVPALAFLAIHQHGERLRKISATVFQRAWASTWLSLFVLAFALPQFLAPFGRDRLDAFFLPGKICPESVDIHLNQEKYYSCINQMAFPAHSVGQSLLSEMTGVGLRPKYLATLFIYLAFILMTLRLLSHTTIKHFSDD